MSDWDQFLCEAPWFVRPGVAVGGARPWARGSAGDLPELSALLGSAALTPVCVAGDAFELLAWGSPDDRRGWLCRPPRDAGDDSVPRAHKSFWALCGGIVERFRGPATWWSNQDEVLTADAARVRIADVLAGYAWLWEGDGLEIAVNPDE
ncbi:MAG TPA: hypothetical protein VMU95_27805 [Trebonia sp.]|nr:hypothetical protein [Trebonia sp.]